MRSLRVLTASSLCAVRPESLVVVEQPLVALPIVQVGLQAGVVAVHEILESPDSILRPGPGPGLHNVVVQQGLIVVVGGGVGCHYVSKEGGATPPSCSYHCSHWIASLLHEECVHLLPSGGLVALQLLGKQVPL